MRHGLPYDAPMPYDAPIPYDGGAMARFGVDYSFSPPTVAELKAAGVTFVCRYVGTPSSGKNLTLAEAGALQAAGIDIVANFEAGQAGWMQGGRTAGVNAAKAAQVDAVRLGMPPERPIYFSADYNATFDQYKTQIKPCLEGAASVLGTYRVGIYGGLEQVDWAWSDGVAPWVWQTYAWSYGTWSKHSRIQQYHNGVPLGSGTVDYDRAIVADFGQWTATGEDITLDAETKTYLDGQFAALAGKVQNGVAILMRGDETTDPTKDTHPDNLQRTRQDLAAGLSAVATRLDTGLKVTLDLSSATPEQLDQLAALIAGHVAIKGVSYQGTIQLDPTPAA